LSLRPRTELEDLYCAASCDSGSTEQSPYQCQSLPRPLINSRIQEPAYRPATVCAPTISISSVTLTYHSDFLIPPNSTLFLPHLLPLVPFVPNYPSTEETQCGDRLVCFSTPSKDKLFRGLTNVTPSIMSKNFLAYIQPPPIQSSMGLPGLYRKPLAT
jgi:hypothetical protein